MKNNTYKIPVVGTVPKSNVKTVERGKIDTPYMQLHLYNRSFSCRISKESSYLIVQNFFGRYRHLVEKYYITCLLFSYYAYCLILK